MVDLLHRNFLIKDHCQLPLLSLLNFLQLSFFLFDHCWVAHDSTCCRVLGLHSIEAECNTSGVFGRETLRVLARNRRKFFLVSIVSECRSFWSTLNTHVIGFIIDRLSTHWGVQVFWLRSKPIICFKNDWFSFLKADCKTDWRLPCLRDNWLFVIYLQTLPCCI